MYVTGSRPTLWLSYILVLLCVKELYNVHAVQKKRIKASRDKVTCPDTCALKRRIGKLELRFQGDIGEIKASCLNMEEVLRNTSNVPVTSADTKIFTNIGGDISANASAKFSAAVQDLRAKITAEYDLLKGALNKVTKESKAISSSLQGDMRESRQREIDLQATIGLLNLTLIGLHRQNAHLIQQTQAIRSQSSVLRAQNEALADDNQKLRSLGQRQKNREADEVRILDLENKLSQQESSVNSIQQQLEWLSSRLDSLSDVADRAQTEAASAAEKANRATQLAKKAISVARRQPVSEDEPKVEPLRQPDAPPGDCWELYQMGYNVSGVYQIRPWRSPESFDVYCEQSYDGGGWTLLQRRRDGSVNFDRDWNAYAEGFGNLEGEMWLGNNNIFYLTNQETYVLQVLLLDWEGNRAYAEYEGFILHSNSDYYAVQFGRYTRGNAGDALRGTVEDGSRNAHMTRFTTKDLDNDNCQPCMVDREAFENCAELQGGGWWFKACSDSNLNGKYIHSRDFGACGDICYGVQWRTWRTDPNYSLKASIMMIKRLNTN